MSVGTNPITDQEREGRLEQDRAKPDDRRIAGEFRDGRLFRIGRPDSPRVITLLEETLWSAERLC